MAIYTLDCNYSVVAETHYKEAFEVFHITLAGVQPSEQLSVGPLWLGTVQAAGGACNTSDTPVGSCSGMYDWSQCRDHPPGDEIPVPETDNAVGCNATNGASSSLLGIALLALVRGRRRAT
jgi:uncharacterized protein (TIGR03382 family)